MLHAQQIEVLKIVGSRNAPVQHLFRSRRRHLHATCSSYNPFFIVTNRVDKTVLNTVKVTWIEGKHKDLTPWLVALVEGVKEPFPSSVVDVMQRCNDGIDKTFSEKVCSEQVTRFESTQRE